MNCTIEWNVLSKQEWERRFTAVPRSTLLQSHPYAKAMCALNHQRVRWGLIKIDGQEAGLVQMLEAGALGFHAWMIDRGPLWFEGYGKPAHLEAFITEINNQFPKRFGRKRRFIPEIKMNGDTVRILNARGFRDQSRESYQTVWLDLRKDIETLRAGLKKNWRGSLQKAEKSSISVEIDDTGEHLSWLLSVYTCDRAERSYHGASNKLLKELAKNLIPQKKYLIFRALIDNQPIAAILILCHGSAATYQVGWTSEKGREKAAHHLLLWQAVQALKKREIKDFDLGGVNDQDADGIKKFKQGMGGELVRTLGLYT